MTNVGKHENRDEDGRWFKGTTGNPAGCGMTNRQRISEKLLADLATVWEAHGEAVLSRLAYPNLASLRRSLMGCCPATCSSASNSVRRNLDRTNGQRCVVCSISFKRVRLRVQSPRLYSKPSRLH